MESIHTLELRREQLEEGDSQGGGDQVVMSQLLPIADHFGEVRCLGPERCPGVSTGLCYTGIHSI